MGPFEIVDDKYSLEQILFLPSLFVPNFEHRQRNCALVCHTLCCMDVESVFHTNLEMKF